MAMQNNAVSGSEDQVLRSWFTMENLKVVAEFVVAASVVTPITGVKHLISAVTTGYRNMSECDKSLLQARLGEIISSHKAFGFGKWSLATTVRDIDFNRSAWNKACVDGKLVDKK